MSKKFKLPKKVKDKWVKALRSGKYKQGEESLKNDFTDEYGELVRQETEYCCLGVACELGLTDSATGEDHNTFVNEDFLPKSIQTFLASYNDGHNIDDYNPEDKKWSFKKIANWIEKNL